MAIVKSLDRVENVTFGEEPLIVDGKQFVACTFEETAFVYAGGTPPTFVGCRFINVSLRFEDSAAATLKFLSGMHRGGFSSAVVNILANIRKK